MHDNLGQLRQGRRIVFLQSQSFRSPEDNTPPFVISVSLPTLGAPPLPQSKNPNTFDSNASPSHLYLTPKNSKKKHSSIHVNCLRSEPANDSSSSKALFVSSRQKSSAEFRGFSPFGCAEIRAGGAEVFSSQWRVQVVSSGSIDGNPQGEFSSELSLDAILSMTEILFIIPPAIYSIGCVLGLLIPGAVKPLHACLGSKVFVWQFLLLVGSVAVGTLIRQRQWGRIRRESESGPGVDLLARIEKVEEDLRSSATIVRVLSRQLEKLGIRFRVTRKALKEPITETAASAQKNFEATRALALQADILEKELGEIQKVLLAMHEQQQKQLELILAIGKASKLLESKRDTSPPTDQNTVDNNNQTTSPIPDKKESKQLEI